MLFNRYYWEKRIQEPGWHIELAPLAKEIFALKAAQNPDYEQNRNAMYGLFEQALKSNTIHLGTVEYIGPEPDRMPIDTLVIHHTEQKQGSTPEGLSAIVLIRLYVPSFTNHEKPEKYGAPIYSGHVRNGQQVFYPYHWLIAPDGTTTRLLNDNEIGWHTGDRDTNHRSVALAFDGYLTDATPTEQALRAAVRIIKDTYPYIPPNAIIGHREINPYTQCPSNLFLPSHNRPGWKQQILANLTT